MYLLCKFFVITVFILRKVCPIQKPFLVFNTEITYSFAIFCRLVLQMTDPGSHVNSHIWKFIQSFGEFINIPFKASQMASYKLKVGMQFKQMITGIDLIFI